MNNIRSHRGRKSLSRIPEDERHKITEDELRIAEIVGDDQEFLERVCGVVQHQPGPEVNHKNGD